LHQEKTSPPRNLNMALYELILPKMGESVAEATIIKWIKQPGDSIDIDESVLEIATDKVDSDVPSPVAGKLVETFYKVDDVVQVGTVIATIETGDLEEEAEKEDTGSAMEDQESNNTEAFGVEQADEVPGMDLLEKSETPESQIKPDSGRFYSPLVRSMAAEEGISQSALDAIEGSGLEGRVTKQDILNYIKDRKHQSSTPVGSPIDSKRETVEVEPVKVNISDGDEIIEMDRMRRLIADHMVMSKHTSPHHQHSQLAGKSESRF
jgi:2-oxoglutarate dehydrogenase E2 component (dihydrolipoamide succinyltransferase)